MADFNITITEPHRSEKISGITWARETINAGMPDVLDETGQRIVPNPNHFATNDAYIAHVLNMAAESYAKASGILT